MSVADYNSDPDLNTTISGINIAEGCPPSGINNAIRQIMADVKTADGGYVKTTGNQTISGTKTYSGGAVFSSGITVSGGMTVAGGISGTVTSATNATNATNATKASYYTSGGGSATIESIGGNGKTVRFPGGMQICYGSGNVGTTSGCAISFGSAFSETPSMHATARPASKPTVTHDCSCVGTNTTGTTVWLIDGSTLRGGNIFWVAVGKWK